MMVVLNFRSVGLSYYRECLPSCTNYFNIFIFLNILNIAFDSFRYELATLGEYCVAHTLTVSKLSDETLRYFISRVIVTNSC